jgi:hypothetical protein
VCEIPVFKTEESVVVVVVTTATANPAVEQYPTYALETEEKSPIESPMVHLDITHLLMALIAADWKSLRQ